MCGIDSTNTSRANPFLLFLGKERNNKAAPEDRTLRERERQTDRQTDRDRERQRQRERQTDRDRERGGGGEKEKRAESSFV